MSDEPEKPTIDEAIYLVRTALEESESECARSTIEGDKSNADLQGFACALLSNLLTDLESKNKGGSCKREGVDVEEQVTSDLLAQRDDLLHLRGQ